MNAPRAMGPSVKQSSVVVESATKTKQRFKERRFPNRRLIAAVEGRRKPTADWRPPLLGACWRIEAWCTNLIVKKFWLVKSEPSAYSWANLVADAKTAWTGVRNFTARNNLRAMRKSDAVLFYHSVTDKAVFGIANVIREAYPDPTAKEGDWNAVDLAPQKALPKPVSLEEIKRNPKLKEMALLRLSRLSVQPVTDAQFEEIARMAKG
jgi:predicted RNA-binding protein with PUA-like domain